MSDMTATRRKKHELWTRNSAKVATAGSAETSLEAENLYLREELDRARLALSGAYPATTMLETIQKADESGDDADTAIAMYAQALAVRTEILGLIQRLGISLADFDSRLQRVGQLDPEQEKLDPVLHSVTAPIALVPDPQDWPPPTVAADPSTTIPTVHGTPDIVLEQPMTERHP